MDNPFSQVYWINLLLTNKCNKQCSYCYEQHKAEFERSYINAHRVDEICAKMDTMNSLQKTLHFFGGEPMLKFDTIMEYMRASSHKYPTLSYVIITNGTLLTPQKFEEFVSHGGSFYISCDGWGIDNTDITTKDFSAIKDVVEACFPVVAAYDKRITFDVVVHPREVASFGRFMQYLASSPYFEQINIHIKPLLYSMTDGLVRWDDTAINHFLQECMNAIVKSKGINFEIEGFYEKSWGTCMTMANNLNVDVEGNFSGCYFLLNQHKATSAFDDAIFGNILTGEIDTVKIANFKRLEQELYQSSKCQSCVLNPKCFQCSAGLYTTLGKWYDNDKHCEIVIPFIQRLNSFQAMKEDAYIIGCLKEKIREHGSEWFVTRFKYWTTVHAQATLLEICNAHIPAQNIVAGNAPLDLGQWLSDAGAKQVAELHHIFTPALADLSAQDQFTLCVARVIEKEHPKT